MKSLSPRTPSYSESQYKRLKQVLENLEKWQSTQHPVKSPSSSSALSLKLFSSQLSQVFLPTSKKKISHKRKPNQQPISLESLEQAAQIIDNKNPKKKEFLTEELMQSKQIHAVLQSRKREFGFKSSCPEVEILSYPAPQNLLKSESISKKLDAILYNNVYKHSQRSKRHHLIREFEGSISNRVYYREGKGSLGIKEIEKLHIGKEFKNLISQDEMELDLIKMKLSKNAVREAISLCSKIN